MEYTDPLLQEVLDAVPDYIRGELDRSFAISEQICLILKQRGWSKIDLAHKTHRSPAEVTKWLSGTQNYTLRTIALIEEALGQPLIAIIHQTT